MSISEINGPLEFIAGDGKEADVAAVRQAWQALRDKARARGVSIWLSAAPEQRVDTLVKSVVRCGERLEALEQRARGTRVVVPSHLSRALRHLLVRCVQPNATWQQWLRHEFGDDTASDMVDGVTELLK